MTPSKPLKYLTLDEWESLISKVTNVRDRALFQVAYWRGLRASEVGMLKIGDWSPDSRRLYIHRGKNGLGGEYVVSDAEYKAIEKWLKDYQVPNMADRRVYPLFPSTHGTGISRRRLDELIKRYGERAGLPPEKCHFHVLRHSIAVHLTQAGYTAQEIKDWLGHKSINSTAVYAQVSHAHRDQMAEEFYQRREGGKSTKPKVKWGMERKRR
jgi:site-specific recombinase XerD